LIKSLYPCFQHWSERGSVYIISDTHFDDFDRASIGYDFSERVQINRLKERCHKNDTLIHLGDVGNPEYMNELKCYKVLIMGNHDQSIEKMKKYFDEVYSGPLWIAKKLVLSHEPIWLGAEERNFGIPIAFNIHGHNHNKSQNYGSAYSLNLAQNVFGYLPLNLKNFIEDGGLKNIKNIHRVIIDNAKERGVVTSMLREWLLDTGVENL